MLDSGASSHLLSPDVTLCHQLHPWPSVLTSVRPPTPTDPPKSLYLVIIAPPFIYLFIETWECMSQCTCGDQKTACRSRFFPPCGRQAAWQAPLPDETYHRPSLELLKRSLFTLMVHLD